MPDESGGSSNGTPAQQPAQPATEPAQPAKEEQREPQVDDMEMLRRSSTHHHPGFKSNNDRVSQHVKPEAAAAAAANTAAKQRLPWATVDGIDAAVLEGGQAPSRRESWLLRRRRTRRGRAAESIMGAIRRHYGTLLDLLSYMGLGLCLYATLYLLIGRQMLPPGNGWAVFLIWVCAHVGGLVAAKLNLPPLLGMLVAGIVLRNIPQDPVKGLPSSWGTKIRTGGLAVILMRAGLKIDKEAYRRAWPTVLRLAILPMLCEAVVDSWLYYWLFSMPIALAFTGGFIQAAISPTVMVTGMLELQRLGYGHQRIIPSILMASAGLDSIGAIIGFAVASGIAIPSGNLVYSILSGPLQVLYGLIVGSAGALVCSWTRLWNNVFKRTASVLVTGLAIMWLGLLFKYLGASSVGCLSLTILAGFAWSYGFPPYLSKGRRPHYAKDVDVKLSVVWVILVQPLLFGCIGVEIDFRQIEGFVIPKTLIILAIGVACVRVPIAFLATFGTGFTLKEQLFVAASWMPKATVQGALGSLPLLLIQSNLKNKSDYAQQVIWGNEILHATAFSILITAPIGLLVIGLLGPRMLKQGSPPVASPRASLPQHRPHRVASDDDSSHGDQLDLTIGRMTDVSGAYQGPSLKPGQPEIAVAAMSSRPEPHGPLPPRPPPPPVHVAQAPLPSPFAGYAAYETHST